MTEHDLSPPSNKEVPSRDIERMELQDRLATVDHDPEKLQDFMRELYMQYPENPQIFYMAGIQLTALSYLDHRADRSPKGDRIELPSPEDALLGFHAYTRLISELAKELHAPGPQNDPETIKSLLGVREEVVQNATLTYATAHGADFLARPTPASIDFGGGRLASDMQIFFPNSDKEKIDAQIKLSKHISHKRINYDPRIPILSLNSILGEMKAVALRGVLKDIGGRDGAFEQLPPLEHGIILDAAGAIINTAHEWTKNQQENKPAA